MKKPFLGFHYDIARGTYPTTDVVCGAIRLAAASGYTHFIPYLENMIRLPSMEKACPACAYTADDWRRFETVAQEAGIEIIPQFNVIGHTELICPSYPEIGGVVDRGHRDLDVERAVTREWTLRCLEEFCQISRSEYFWIGADEWQAPQHLLARPGFDVARAWVGHVNEAVEFLANRGRRALVAHDMLIHYPSAIELLSPKSVILFWFYDHDSDYAALEMFKRLGFETIMVLGVFGGDSPRLTHRCVDAIRCGVAAARKYQADGLLVTTWEGARWELETANASLIANLIRGEEPPSAVVDALTLLDASTKLPADSKIATGWKSRARELLQDAAWSRFPELRRCSLAVAGDDAQDDLASYAQFHQPQGHQYDRIAKGNPRPDWPAAPQLAKAQAATAAFGLTIEKHPKAGPLLRFFNGDESFEVYPNYGATLQHWRCGSQVIIPAAMDRFLEKDRFPGGYRSYSPAGGFRPIWAMGTHSNPCILWQHPYSWSVTRENPDAVEVELHADFYHVAVSLRIGIRRGQSGFTYEARGVNKFDGSYGAFNFNLPLTFTLSDLEETKFSWSEEGQSRETTVASQARSAFWIPARESLTIARPSWSLTVHSAAEQTTGYFVDWGPGFITPDLHGVYRKLKPGDEIATRWEFILNR